MHDMTSTLPFTSKASTQHPTRSFEPQKRPLPPVPRVPDVPNRLTKLTWKQYCGQMSDYLIAFHVFNRTMHNHFQQRLIDEDQFIQACPVALENIGQSGVVGLMSYGQAVREDEQFRECWTLAHEKHLDAVKTFQTNQARVKTLMEGPGLVDI